MSEFLADARVLVRPDTTGFRAELITQIAAATKGVTATIPVVAVAAAGGAANITRQAKASTAAANQTTRAAAQMAGANAQVAASANKASAATADLTRIYGLNAASAARLAGVEEAMSLTTTGLAASRARLREVNAAAAASNLALSRAIATGNVALVSAQVNVTRLVQATRLLAVADVQTAIAEEKLAAATNARATAQGFAKRGALASILSLVGVRGATLAANSAFLVGAASAVIFFKSISIAARVEKQLNTFRVTAKATGEEMSAVAARARELGNDIRLPAVSAGDAVTTMVELSKAGLDVAQSMAAAEGALQLATAAEIDNAAAVELVANALNVFQLNGNEAATVADLLAASSLEAQGSIEDMGIALRQSAAVANQAGLSVSETVTLLTELARAGLAGSDAGTTLRVAISRLIAPTEKAREEIEKLNLNLREASTGNLRVDVFTQLGKALEDVSKADRSEILVRIFGENAQRVGAILSDVTNPALRATEKAVTRAGVAAEVSAAKVEGLGGKLERTKNEAEDLGLTFGKIFGPAAGAGLDIINIALDQTNATVQQAVKGFEELGKFEDDANRLAVAFKQISDDSGFSDFAQDVADGARLVASDITRASDAADRFTGNLLGIGGGADKTTPKIKGLSKAEIELAESTRDANLGLAEQIARLNAVGDAAEKATVKASSASQLDLKVATAQAQGDTGAELAALRQQEANQQRFIDRLSARPQDKATVATLIEANRNIDATRDQIQAILDRRVSEAKSAAADIVKASNEADQAILDGISSDEGKLLNAQIKAEATAGVKDDIAAAVALRNFYKQSVAEVRRTVTDAKTAASAIAGLISDQIRATQEIARSKEELKEALRAERQAERERIRESLSLDVQIAQATGNKSKEIKARQAEIDRIKVEIRQTREGSNQRKRLILELRQKQKELRDLEGAKKETNNAAAKFFFEQLQAQQGFAANLLGNLITGPTAGLVGVPSTTSAIRPERGVAAVSLAQEGKQAAGVSAGQANTTNDILLRILRQLRQLNGATDAPEAIIQKKSSNAIMDGIGGV